MDNQKKLEQQRKASKKYYQLHKDEVKARHKKYRIGNPEKRKEVEKKWYYSHQEQAINKSKKWNKENSDRHLDNVREWNKNNRKRYKENKVTSDRNKRILKKTSGDGWTSQEERELKNSYGFCVYCNKKKPLTVDHVVPISKKGSHSIDNAVPACRDCNSKKQAKPLLIFLYERNS